MGAIGKIGKLQTASLEELTLRRSASSKAKRQGDGGKHRRDRERRRQHRLLLRAVGAATYLAGHHGTASQSFASQTAHAMAPGACKPCDAQSSSRNVDRNEWVHCSKELCNGRRRRFVVLKGYEDKQPVSCPAKDCSATLPKKTKPPCSGSSNGAPKAGGGLPASEREELIELRKLKASGFSATAALQTSSAGSDAEQKPAVKCAEAEAEIAEHFAAIKKLSEYISQLKSTGTEVISRVFNGDILPTIRKAESDRDQLYALIRELRPVDEQAKSAQNRSEQLAKQVTAAERTLANLAKARDEANEKAKAAQQEVDKHNAALVHLRTTAAEAAGVASDLKARSSKCSAAPPHTTASSASDADLDILVQLAHLQYKQDPQALLALSPAVQERLKEVIADKERAANADTAAGSIGSGSPLAATGSTHGEASAQVESEAAEEEVDSYFVVLAQEASPMEEDEDQQNWSTKINVAAKRSAKRAKTDGKHKFVKAQAVNKA